MDKLPESCDECIYDGCKPYPYKRWIYDRNGRPDNCPLIEVTERWELIKGSDQGG